MTTGAAPRGAAGQEAARWVQSMFARVAGRYDLLNHLLSFNLDRRWRARAAARVRHVLETPGARVMDLCCGTGDLLIALAAEAARREACPTLYGSDFCRPMLAAASHKLARRHVRAFLIEADALSLPLADVSLDLITVAFGFRNLADYRQGLLEMRRVLRPGGVAAILEFSRPRHRAFARLYDFYSRHVLPAVGGLVSGAPDAYQYLPESVRGFPSPEALAQEMSASGFFDVEFELLSGGIVALHVGKRCHTRLTPF